ncbi:MAG TPA: hypothetical protein VNH18_07225, partial [Bryobacteraceae bacterium]|nr:hypothetical protein [Bryobacteraceae bacterium]
MSAVSEYGFDVDFPVTPTFWLVIAFCVMFASFGHAVLSQRIPGFGKQEIGTNLSGETLSQSHFANSKCVDVKSLRISDRSPNLYQPDLTVTGAYHRQMSAGGVLVTPGDAIPVVIFPNPVA